MKKNHKTLQGCEIPLVTTRSGRVVQKSTKLMGFKTPDDIETVKAKKMASVSKKLNMVTHIKMEPELDINHVLPVKHFNEKIGVDKAQRKDEEARHSISQSNPELDSASVSKRLGEMWTNVPTNVKRRANRLAIKIKKSDGAKGQAPQLSKYMQQKYCLNKDIPKSNSTSALSASSAPIAKQRKQLQKVLQSEKAKKLALVPTKLNIIDTPHLLHIKRKPEANFSRKKPKTDSETESETETKSEKPTPQLIQNVNKKPTLIKIELIPSTRTNYKVPSAGSQNSIPIIPITKSSNSDLFILGL